MPIAGCLIMNNYSTRTTTVQVTEQGSIHTTRVTLVHKWLGNICHGRRKWSGFHRTTFQPPLTFDMQMPFSYAMKVLS